MINQRVALVPRMRARISISWKLQAAVFSLLDSMLRLWYRLRFEKISKTFDRTSFVSRVSRGVFLNPFKSEETNTGILNVMKFQ